MPSPVVPRIHSLNVLKCFFFFKENKKFFFDFFKKKRGEEPRKPSAENSYFLSHQNCSQCVTVRTRFFGTCITPFGSFQYFISVSLSSLTGASSLYPSAITESTSKISETPRSFLRPDLSNALIQQPPRPSSQAVRRIDIAAAPKSYEVLVEPVFLFAIIII